MTQHILRSFGIACLFFLLTGILASPAALQASQQSSTPTEISLENKTPQETDAILAKLSDEQVRSLLLAELQKEAAQQTNVSNSDTGLFSMVVRWLHLLDSNEANQLDAELSSVTKRALNIKDDSATISNKFRADSGGSSLWKNFFLILFVFVLGFIIQKIWNASTASFHRKIADQVPPRITGFARFLAGILHSLPALTSLLVFVCSSVVVFLLTPLSSMPSFRLLFMAALFIILFVRLIKILSHIFCAPQNESLRLLNISDPAAVNLDLIIRTSLNFIVFSFALLAFSKEIGISSELGLVMVLVLGSMFLLLMAYWVIRNRDVVTQYILTDQSPDESGSWLVQQFAALWHILALLYLFIVWLNFLYMQISGTAHKKEVLLLSLIVVPLFLLLDHIGQWVVKSTVGALRIYSVEDKKEDEALIDPAALSPEQKEHLLVARVGMWIRFIIIVALIIYVLNLWGYDIPYAAAITQAVFESLITLSLALLFWRVASTYIEKKINEGAPEVEEDKDEDGDGWGGVQRGRSYTLLPMVRKFIGTVLTVMVTLIILSSIGVNIGPLLAGAGVIGLAIGFGAQKLVSDVFSGFFYLMDDAFRIGEYLQTGNIMGTVENITLRNVMLRHHRGMLQIVPYSELGSITNFMRGGMVIKFNLEFPYGTDIDLVRRIIKKVGVAMMEDEELGKDFIQPVKSQGVREITNSVMVIRVKFTAKPGTQFVIRREAYRRITDALAKKGIHYAHRKVIVEMPESVSSETPEQQKAIEAGAAAALTTIAEDEKKS